MWHYMKKPKIINGEYVSKQVVIILDDKELNALISDCQVYGSSLVDDSSSFHIVKEEFLDMDMSYIENESTKLLVKYIADRYGKDNEVGDLVFCY